MQNLSTPRIMIDTFSMTSTQTLIQVAAATDLLLRASDLGVAPYALVQAEKAGILERISPGIYIGPQTHRHPLAEVAGWTLRQPTAVACLLTAAMYYQLTEAFEGGTWLFVPIGASPPRSRVVSVRVVQTAPRWVDPAEDEVNGIVHLQVHGVAVRITGSDRTVLDLWRFPSLISEEHALHALRQRIRAPDFRIPTFACLAQRLNIWKRIQPVLQGMVA